MEGDAHAVVLRTLEIATSQDATMLRPAEEQLKSWERQRGFYSTLQSIYLDHSLQMNVRWLAVVYFKNGIDRYWRPTAPNAICEEEKSVLRTRMISSFNEPVPQIATQISVLIGKIARVDCPRQWPELVPTLIQAVKSDDKLLQQRSLLALHHVIKALASKRLLPDRQLFQQLTENMFPFIITVWNGYATSIVSHLQTQNDLKSLDELWNSAQICLKVLRKLFVHGFSDQSHKEMNQFMQLVLEQTRHFLEIGKHTSIKQCEEKREKYLTALTKVLLDGLTYHSLWLVPFLEAMIALVIEYNFTDHGRALVYERFTVNCFVLIKEILRCEQYKLPKDIEDTKKSQTLQANQVVQTLFSQSTIVEITRQLTCQYFLYTMEDLNEWEENPEEFISEESGDVWKYSLRPCAEVLFLIIIKEHRQTITPFLIELVKQSQELGTNDLENSLRKDAIYNSIGLASFDLFDEIDFNQWFSNRLVQELSDSSTNKLLQRRIIWLIGQWVNVNLNSELRPTLYQVIVELLKPDRDLVVRLQAANTLKLAIDDFEFKIDQFVPYLESNFALLFELLREVVECETKMHILHVMSFMIERSDKAIKPHAPALLQYLPQLWAASEQHNLLRCAIMTTLMHLTSQGLGTDCVQAYSILLPVIELATDLNQPDHVYLLEDGLDLWKVVIQCSPSPASQQLLDAYRNMPALLEYGTENLITCLKLIESYLYLDPSSFLQTWGQSLFESLRSMLTDIREDARVLIHRIIELCIKLLPMDAPRLFEPLLYEVLHSILRRDEHSVLMSVNLSIIGRIYLVNREFFSHLLDQYAKQTNQQTEILFQNYLDVFIDKLDVIVQPEKRKLAGLVFASMLSLDSTTVRQRFEAIVSMCVEVLHDVCRLKDDESCSQVDYFLLSNNTKEEEEDEYGEVPCVVRDSEDESEHEKRKHASRQGDPVYTVSMKQFTSSQLAACQRTMGEDQFQQEEDVRPDGRALGEYRETVINSGSITTADGSAMVKLGHTTVVCGIKAELAAPKRDTPDIGYVVPNLELPPLCSSQFKPGPPPEQAQVMSQLMYDVVSQCGSLSLSDLCIAKGKWCWVLYCDLMCLDYSGNVFDASLISLITALKSVRLPEVTYDEESDKLSVNVDVKSPLKLGPLPVATSFAVVDGILLVDPTKEEEELSQGYLRIATVDDEICLMDKNGGAALSDDRISDCIDRAHQQARLIRQKLCACALTDIDR